VLGGGADLFTEAHEAAHVVQQRGGVQLKGGVGAAGDTYERHADAVATAVVRGESAESLLDPVAGGGSIASGPIQKRDLPADAPTVGPGIDINNPLGSLGLNPTQAMALGADWAAVRQWVTAHRAAVSASTAMPSLVQRVRTEVGQKNPSLNAASEQTIAEYIRDACRSLSIPLATDAAVPPAPDTSSPIVDSVKAALSAAKAIAAVKPGLSVEVSASGPLAPAAAGAAAPGAMPGSSIQAKVTFTF
jgi:hypothetical protein